MSDLLVAAFALMALLMPLVMTARSFDRWLDGGKKELPASPSRNVVFRHYVQGERLLMQDWEDAFADAIKDLNYPRLVDGPPSYQNAVGFARAIREAYPEPAFGEKGWCSAADEFRGRCEWQRRRA